MLNIFKSKKKEVKKVFKAGLTDKILGLLPFLPLTLLLLVSLFSQPKNEFTKPQETVNEITVGDEINDDVLSDNPANYLNTTNVTAAVNAGRARGYNLSRTPSTKTPGRVIYNGTKTGQSDYYMSIETMNGVVKSVIYAYDRGYGFYSGYKSSFSRKDSRYIYEGNLEGRDYYRLSGTNLYAVIWTSTTDNGILTTWSRFTIL